MDIKILDSWLREFLKTKAAPEQIARDLSLTSQSVERVNRWDKDCLYEIEATTNRPDAFSVYGIARELSAILPRFGIKAKLLPIPGAEKEIPKVKKGLPLTVEIIESSLVPHFTALIFDQVTIKPSPDFVQKRLESAGIRSLNNVIDVSNYLMLELGQPMHTFDYDKIEGAKMIVRESKEGEKLVTLDGQERKLPAGTIVIEDGSGKIIDLCGIMGGKNSEVDEKTKRVLLFIQTYDPLRIRRSCQALGFRTEAASRFEKGIDPEGVLIAMKRAVELLHDWAGGKVGSKLFDIYPHPLKTKKVTLAKERLDRLMGVEIKLTEAKEILESLGFAVDLDAEDKSLTAAVPHWRYNDISLPEDLIEEVARIYGYQNLPNILPPLTAPQNFLPIFEWEKKAKEALKYWGFTEVSTYSMVGKDLLAKTRTEEEKHLKLANPLTEDLTYLRSSLIPSLLEVVNKNQEEDEIKIFEMANIYLPRGKESLPQENMTLTILRTKERFFEQKGFLEALLNEMGIFEYQFILKENTQSTQNLMEIHVRDCCVGILAEVAPDSLERFDIKTKVTVMDFDFGLLVKFATKNKVYIPISKFPPIIEDFSFIFPPGTAVGEAIRLIKAVSPLIKNVELLDSYENTRTFRVVYQSNEKNLTDKDIEPVREKIISALEKKNIELRK